MNNATATKKLTARQIKMLRATCKHPTTIWCPGGKVWYAVRKKGNDRTLYQGFISKWMGEHHIYNLTAIDAVKGN